MMETEKLTQIYQSYPAKEREGRTENTQNSYLRLPYSLSGVFSYQPLTLLIHVGYPQTCISMESL